MFSADRLSTKCAFSPKNGPIPRRPVNGYAWSWLRRTALGTTVCLAVAAVLTLVTDVAGQVRAPARGESDSGADKDKDGADDNAFVRADRLTLQKLADAKRLLAEERFGEAVRYLGEILDGTDEDFFLRPDKQSPTDRSLRLNVLRLIGQMPREGRELYELQYGARARRMLDEAIQSGSATRLAEVSRRFFYTHAGYQATLLLGLNYFDRGQPELAALSLQRLREAGPSAAEEFEPGLSLTMATCWLQAGAEEKARKILTSLGERHPTARVVVGGREVAMFSGDTDPVDWLRSSIGRLPAVGSGETEGWPMFRGDAARDASSPGGAPLLNARWQVRSTDEPAMQTAVEQWERSDADRGTPSVASFHPLAVGNVLLMRTLHNLLAVDFVTGKRLWESPSDDGDETSLSGDAESWQQTVLQSADQRMRSDLTYGTLSSDGRRVFSIEDSLMMTLSGPVNGRGMNPFGRRGNPLGFGQPAGSEEQAAVLNRLAAYDIRTGKLAWNLGGPAGEHALRQSETYFLGPPLPLWGQLYVLAEAKGEIKLLALDAATGDLLWSQQLAAAESGVLQNPMRCWSGISPSYADGVLVCPTSVGAIVGVELATRSLLWGYQYGQIPGFHGRRGRPMMGAWGTYGGGPMPSAWLDAEALLVDGRVLVTPQESDSLYCLNLSDGKVLWKSRWQDDLYVACADREKVVLVGHRAVRALRLANGKPAWNGRKVALPENSTPSGRGFLSGGQYFLPLGSGEVVGIDLDAGKIGPVSKSRKGDVPGNLIAYRGWVVSLGLDGMKAYYQLDSAQAEIGRRLKSNPNDTEALTLRGEMLLDSGNRDDAIASFRRAYESKAEPRTRTLLRDSLLEGLQSDFAGYRNRHEEVERLLDDSSQRASYFRLMIGGLRQEGDAASAFDYCQKLIDLTPERPPLDQISKTFATRRDRWVQSQLAALRGEARGETAAKIDAALEERWKAASAAGSIERLQDFLGYFDRQPIAATARRELISRLKGAGRLLEAELLLWAEMPSTAAGDRATATARVAELLSQAGRAGDAASCYWWLGRQFADVKCDDGRTGKQWLESHATEDAVRQLLSRRETTWPMGNIETTPNKVKNPDNSNFFNPFSLELHGDPGPFFSDVLLGFDQGGHTLVARDGWGREQWRIALSPENVEAFNAEWIGARANGHLLLVSLGGKVVAIDTLISGAKGAPQMLWSRNMMGLDKDPADVAANPVRIARMGVAWPQFRGPVMQPNGRSGPLGPVTNRYVCFRRGRSLMTLDPQTGAVLWTRQDLPLGNELFGDEEHVFVVSPNKEEATLLRAVDGEMLGTRKIPRPKGQQQLADGTERTGFVGMDEAFLGAFGRRLLSWRMEKNEHELAFVDALDGQDVWPRRKFAYNAQAALLGEEAVGVFEPSGRFVLVALSDGHTVADVKLEAEPTLMEIVLLSSGDQFFLLTNGAIKRSLNFSPIAGLSRKPIQSGRLYAFDKQGTLQWKTPAVVKAQFLLTHQPAWLPVLTFASNTYEQKRNGQGQSKLSLLCIDKRTGRAAYEHEFPGAMTQSLVVTGDAEAKSVDLTMQRTAVTLKFTDNPIPSPPAAGTGEPPAGGKTVHAIWDSLQKTFGRIMDESSQEDEH
jgi:outer membrane protein assembly factor BamB/tetratricopeptide (TPR) repeat protein